MAFRDPELLDPVVTSVARCSSCGNLFILGKDELGMLDFQSRECSKCGQYLSVNAILSSYSNEIAITKAVASANKLTSLDLAIIPMLGAGAIAAWVGYPISLRLYLFLAYVTPLTIEIRWFYKHWYRVHFDDTEYLQVVRRMKLSLALWVGANAINLAFLFV